MIGPLTIAGITYYFVPPGTSALTAQLSITDPTRIIGLGPNVSILNCQCDVAIGGGNVSDLEIVGVGFTGSVRRFVSVSGPGKGVRIKRCSFTGATLAVPSTITAALYVEGVDQITIDDCDFSGNGLGPVSADSMTCAEIYIDTQPSSGHTIRNNRITGQGTHCSVVCFNVSDSEVIGNRIDQGNVCCNTANNGYAILLYTTSGNPFGSGNRVTGNRVRNCAGTGIYLLGQTVAVCADNIVTNTCQQQIGNSLAVGGIAGEFDHCTITGNVVDGVAGVPNAGIVEVGSFNTITGNVVKNCPYAGVWVRGSQSANNVVTGTAFDVGTGNTHIYDQGTGTILGVNG